MKKKSPKKSTALIIKKEPTVQDLVNMFAGSSSLVQNEKVNERNLILRVAEAFAVPAVCVNIMGGLPYINKDGLLFKLEEYENDQILSLTTRMVQYSTHPGERAIAEANLSLKDGRSFNAIGEADENSVKLVAVKQTLNMMAETRAQNRVIRRAIQSKMLRDLYTQLGDKKSPYTEDEKNAIQNAVQNSAEEMTNKATLEAPKNLPPMSIPKKEILSISLNKINVENDPIILAEWRKKIETSKLYNDNQKRMLYGVIDNKIKKYAEAS